MIKLDLFRLLPDIKEELYEEVDLDCRYTPYRIFVMETRLYPTIYKMFLFNISVCPKSVYNSKTNRMDVYLNISKNVKDGEEEVVLSQDEREIIQKRIDKITSEDIKKHLISIWEKAEETGDEKLKLRIVELMRKIFSMFNNENDIKTENKSK